LYSSVVNTFFQYGSLLKSLQNYPNFPKKKKIQRSDPISRNYQHYPKWILKVRPYIKKLSKRSKEISMIQP